jgi:hypothetical protein
MAGKQGAIQMRRRFVGALIVACALCGVAAPAGASTVTIGPVGSTVAGAEIQFNYDKANPSVNYAFVGLRFGTTIVFYRCRNTLAKGNGVVAGTNGTWGEIVEVGSNCHRVQ